MKIKFVLPFLISLTLLSQQYWLSVPSPTTKKLQRCHFLDTLFGWACGDSGIVIHTSNGGINWIVQNTGIDAPIDDIFFTSRFNGWAVANDFLFNGTIILRTTNGGNIWTNSRYPDSSVVFNAVHFTDSLNGFLTGFSGRVFRTTNGGSNWFETYVDSLYCPFIYLFPKWRISFLNSQTGYMAGGQIDIQGMVWQTTNGGYHWFTYCVTPEPLYDVKAINASKVIAAGGDFEYGTITAQTYT
ncbi:MAG: YCF48-related protein, partial [Ignavibacteria bacterium]|nr:YCF48-related protein [Ignavibacteria bacterium]